MRRISVVGFGLFVCSCVAEFSADEERVETEAQEVRGGFGVTPGEHAAVGALLYNGTYFCSGTLIDPLHVLTAAHCFIESDFAQPSVLQFSTDYGPPYYNRFTVADIYRHPSYQPSAPLPAFYDVAVMTLSQNASISSFPQVAQNNTILGYSPWPSLELVGYGQANSTDTGGSKRKGFAFGTNLGMGSLAPKLFSVYPGEYNQISCSGDSGGPALSGSTIMGISHAGYPDCDTNPRSYYTDITSYASWISTEMRAFQNPRYPLDVNDDGHYTALDALLIIDVINARGSGVATRFRLGQPARSYLDANGDGWLTAMDTLSVINNINAFGARKVDPTVANAVLPPLTTTQAQDSATGNEVVRQFSIQQDTARGYTQQNVPVNWGRRNEKWVYSYTYGWHFILPNGKLYRYTGLNAQGEAYLNSLYASYTPAYYDNLSMLYAPQ